MNAAVEKKSPVIISASLPTIAYMGLKQVAYMGKAMAESVDIPVCLLLDHATDYDIIKESVKAGFSAVMIDASRKDYETNLADTKMIVDFASKYGCSVESELGKVGGKLGDEDPLDPSSTMTNPDDVVRFVNETGIDALAVGIGTTHGFYKSEPKLDFVRLAKIMALTQCPIVLHGGSGVSAEDFRTCIQYGMSKINVGTELKAAYTNSLRDVLAKNPEEIDLRKFMGAVKESCAAVVREKMDIFNSTGKA